MMRKLYLILIMCLISFSFISAYNFEGQEFGFWEEETVVGGLTNVSGETVNDSLYWIGMGAINTTQMEDNGGTLNILQSWLSFFGNGLWCALTGCTMEGDIDMGNNEISNVLDVNITQMKGNNGYGSVNDFFKLYGSPGRLTGGIITNPSGTSIVVEAGNGMLRIADDDISQLKFIGWDASGSINVPTNSIMYFGIEYNGGSPQVFNTTINKDWDLDTSFPLGSAINQGGEIYILNNPWWVGDGLTNMIEKSEGVAGHLARDREVGGLILGYTGTRNPTMTAGTLWGRTNEFEIPDFDASGTDTFDIYYRDGAGGYAEFPDQTQWNVTSYDDGSGTLQPYVNNRYGVWWVWVNVASEEIAMIYPQAQYTSTATAEAEEIPNTFPAMWYEGGIIIGRIIVQEGMDVPVEVQSVFTQTFTAAQAADHGNLAGLTDDDHPQYLLTNGSRTLNGNLNVAGNTTTSNINITQGDYPIYSDTFDWTGLGVLDVLELVGDIGSVYFRNAITIRGVDNFAQLNFADSSDAVDKMGTATITYFPSALGDYPADSLVFANANGSYYFDNNVTASYFKGDGSELTGINGMDYTNVAMQNESNTFTKNQTFTGTRHQLMPNLWTCQLTPTSNPIITSNLTKSIADGKC